MARQGGPDVVSALPSIFLQNRPKLGLPEPEHPKVGLVGQGMLRQSHPLQGLGIQPIDIGVGVARIPGSSIDFPSIHRPQIRDNVQIMLGNVAIHLQVNNAGHQLRVHYSDEPMNCRGRERGAAAR